MTPEEITQVYKSGLDAVVELILRIEQENLLLKEKIDRLNRDSTFIPQATFQRWI